MNVIKNPDTEFVADMKKRIKANNGYCPCRLEHIPETKCMCKEFREQVKNNIPGSCHCGLYVAEEE